MIFVKIYRYFTQHKILLYTLLILSSAVFLFFGTRVQFEEDLMKLLPASEKNETVLVFGNLKIKDKIFMEMTGAEPEVMAGYVDELMDSILANDEGIANTLYRLEPEMALNALDFAMMHVPSFVDTGLYARFDSAIAHADETMAQNHDLIMNDEDGAVTDMVTTDPLNLRECLMPDLSSGVGFTLIDGHLFCADSTVALMFISPTFQSFDSEQGSKLMKHIRHCLSNFRQTHPDVEVLMHGNVVRAGDNSRTMKRDTFFTVGISLLIILIVLGICFKSFNITWQHLLPVVYGTFFSLSCMYWLQGGMSLMALGVGAVVLGVALSYCLHIVIHQRCVGNVERMLKEESWPVCLGCLTTIGAFLGLLFTQSDLLKDFGLFSTFALIGNTLFALIFLPHFLHENETQHNEKIFKGIEKINNYAYDRNPFIIIGLCAVIIVGIIFSGKVQFDNDLQNIGYESDELHKSENLYSEKNNHGGTPQYYAVLASSLDEALDANKTLSTRLDSLYKAGEIIAYTPTVSMLFQSQAEQERRIDAWKRYWTPEKVNEAMAAVRKAATAHELSPDIFVPFQAMVEAEYEPGDLYTSEVIPEGLLCNFIEEADGNYLIFNTTQQEKEKMMANSDIIATVPHALVVDPFYYAGNMVTLIQRDFNTTLLISSLFVLLVLILWFKDLVIAVIAFLPMFLSWYVVQGWMAILGWPFNLINIVISTFVFGIGVDYSIFVMQGLIAAQRNEGNQLLENHKIAVFFSAFVLIVVMISMLCATHPTITSIGRSAIIGMVSTIMITYTLQPLLFRWVMKWPYLRNRVEKKKQ
ncbi:MAG: MMPL family transporter [Bacteroidales bacterium]|nr:MMPL family transporter [Bacteroidales bacterium]